MSYLKQFKSVNIFKNIKKISLSSHNSFCDGKNINSFENIKIDKEGLPKIDKESLIFDYEIEDETPSERKREARVSSKLSKEYNRLMINGGNVINLSDGFKLAVDDSVKSDDAKRDLPLDDTVCKLKKSVTDKSSSDSPPPKDPKDPEDLPPPPKQIFLTRQLPGKVIWGFVPQEWTTFFYPKTGVTGFYTFLVATGTFLVSKEYFVLEHNFYNGLSMAVMVWGTVKYVGPHVTKWLDKELEVYENSWISVRQANVDYFNEVRVYIHRFRQSSLHPQLLTCEHYVCILALLAAAEIALFGTHSAMEIAAFDPNMNFSLRFVYT
uniref:ATP synthase subunit b n=1 Tax=Diabrotica virgifera virgifera TaxID=50390 RepID=A0A6P7G9H8_DIAVI